MKELIEFLELNGFKKIDHDIYQNNRCYIRFISNDEEELVKVLFDGNKSTQWSLDGMSLHTLIGYLTYYELMDKNYKQK